MAITSMETLAARMVEATERTTKLMKTAGKWLGNAKKLPERAVHELRQKGTDISRRADEFHKQSEGLDGAEAVCAEKFEAGMRVTGAAVLMSATGVLTRDTTMLRLAELAQREGAAVMTAAWLTTQNWDQALGA